MARQKSEDLVVPEGRRRSPPIVRRGRGGKEVPVDQEMGQPVLPFATAEAPRGTVRTSPAARAARRGPQAVPKASVLDEKTLSTAMESVVERLDEALVHVARNRGAPVSDGLTIEAVQQDWPRIRDRLPAGGDARRRGGGPAFGPKQEEGPGPDQGADPPPPHRPPDALRDGPPGRRGRGPPALRRPVRAGAPPRGSSPPQASPHPGPPAARTCRRLAQRAHPRPQA